MTKKRSNSSQHEEEESVSEDQILLLENHHLGKEELATLRLVETTDRALELIDSLSNEPQRFEGDDPGDLFDKMDEMRQSLQSAWKDVLNDNDDNENDTDDSSNPRGSKRTRDGPSEEEYRSAYVETMAEVLEAPLDAMRQQHEQDEQQSTNGGKKAVLDMDVDLIVEALQSGIDLLHPEEKMLFLEELQAIENEGEQDDNEATNKGESIHMMRRKELGYDV
ncbi:unnamed protein product [Cylindrotheca closterium]|uniref:Uncharacterized protein n=1 Tax=Cylindrotheca closterium TaxID=2856 RepID=A0AAD2CDX6_9STRA|nr:unnamed protein product [Cylindrotheca closterium]